MSFEIVMAQTVQTRKQAQETAALLEALVSSGEIQFIYRKIDTEETS